MTGRGHRLGWWVAADRGDHAQCYSIGVVPLLAALFRAHRGERRIRAIHPGMPVWRQALIAITPRPGRSPRPKLVPKSKDAEVERWWE